MKTPYREVFEKLNAHQVRYLVAGGFAVNFHQVQRATVDLDLILHLEEKNILTLVKLMKELGFVPRVPVKGEDFANPKIRKSWIEEKGMMVFSYIKSNHSYEVIDFFVEEPFPFEEAWMRRIEILAFGVQIPVLGKKDLIYMKEKAGRDKDRFDVEQLKKTKTR